MSARSDFVMVPSGHELEEKQEGKNNKLMMKNNIVLVRSWNQNNKINCFWGLFKKAKSLGKYRNSFACKFLKDPGHIFGAFLPTVLCTFCHIYIKFNQSLLLLRIAYFLKKSNITGNKKLFFLMCKQKLF